MDGLGRRAVGLLTAAAAIAAIAAVREGRTTTAVAWAAAAGFLAVASPLWNMGDASIGGAALLGFLGVAAAHASAGRAAIAGAAVGIALAVIALAGPESLLRSAFADSAYWASFSRDLWQGRMPDASLLSLARGSLQLGIPSAVFGALTQGAAIAALAGTAVRAGVGGALRRFPVTTILLAASIASARIPAELGYGHYFLTANIWACLLAAALAAEVGAAKAAIGVVRGSAGTAACSGAVAVAALIVAWGAWQAGNGLAVLAQTMARSKVAWGMPDHALLRPADADLAERVRSVAKGLPAGSCLVMATSSATWNHLAGLPSCGRAALPIYTARPDRRADVVKAATAAPAALVILAAPPDDFSHSPSDRMLPELFAWARSLPSVPGSDGNLRLWLRPNARLEAPARP